MKRQTKATFKALGNAALAGLTLGVFIGTTHVVIRAITGSGDE